MGRTGHIPFTGNPQANHTAIVSTMQQILTRLDQLETNPTIRGDLDMQGGRIKNIGDSANTGDATSRGELVRRGLYENDQRQHVAHSDLIVRGNIRSRAQARDRFDLVPLWQVFDIINNNGSAGSSLTFGTQDVTLVNGANHNVALESRRVIGLVTGPTAAFSISGFVSPRDTNVQGRVLILVNETGFPMTILDRSNGLSVATNRIATNKDVDFETQGDGVIVFCYLNDVWRILAAIL